MHIKHHGGGGFQHKRDWWPCFCMSQAMENGIWHFLLEIELMTVYGQEIDKNLFDIVLCIFKTVN